MDKSKNLVKSTKDGKLQESDKIINKRREKDVDLKNYLESLGIDVNDSNVKTSKSPPYLPDDFEISFK